MDYTSVKFVENHPPYLKGESARFPAKRAEALISRGVAVSIEPELDTSASQLKAIRSAPETRHIAGPANTRQVEGPVRRCGICGEPGHTRANCPKK